MRFVGILLVAVLAAGCRPRSSGAVPAPSGPTPAGPAATRIGVVDLDAVARAHPRWPELDALNKQVERVEGELLSPPPPPPVDQARLQALLDVQAKQLQAELDAQLRALNERQQQKLDEFTAEVRLVQQARLELLGKQLDDEGRRAIQQKAAQLEEEFRRFELQVMAEYRFPLANLRLKADVVGLADEEELRRVSAEMDRVQSERDERIRAKGEALSLVLAEFERAKEAEARAAIERATREAEAQTKTLVAAKGRELEAEAGRVVKTTREAFERRLAQVRASLLKGAEGQLRSAQGRYAEGLRKREQQLTAERQALLEQRARLQDSILADVRIEVAAIAANRGLNVVLTSVQLNLTAEDITQEVVARLKR